MKSKFPSGQIVKHSPLHESSLPYIVLENICYLASSFLFRLKEYYNMNADFRGGNVDRMDTASPFYNKLSQYPNGGQSYGIDEPDARFSTSPNSVPSSQFQNRLSGQSSTLPRTGTGSGPDSVVSDKHFPGSPPGTLRGQDPALSFSTPAVSHDIALRIVFMWAGSEARMFPSQLWWL